MTIALDADVKTLTEEQLDTLYMDLVNRQDDVLTERRRRDALPFIWASDAAAIAAIRKALGKPEQVGSENQPEAWQAPTSPMDAYIAGDIVSVSGKAYRATGKGGIYVKPGTNDPIQGEVWQDVAAAGEEPAE